MKKNNHVSAPDMMEFVLQEIGLGYVAGKFKEEKADIEVVTLATDEDLIKLSDRTIRHFVRLSDMCRRYYDTTNNNTHGGSYSYTITTRPNTTSSM